jgi:acetyl esterase/lipase
MVDALRRLIVLAGVVLPVGAWARTGVAPHGGTVFADQHYSSLSDRLTMDIYVPVSAGRPPLVIWVHGGGFWGGDKRDLQVLGRVLPVLEAAGIAVAAVNYRLSGEAIWPAQRDDLAAAVAFLRDRAAEYGCDGDRMAIFGASAGGTLALVAGFDGAAGLRAVAAWYPATQFDQMDSDMGQEVPVPRAQSMARKGSMISRLVGKAVGGDPAPALRASPLTVLAGVPPDQALPPVLLAAGAEDRTISWRQSERMAVALRGRARPPLVVFRVYPASGHGSGAFDGVAIGDLRDFLVQHLGP